MLCVHTSEVDRENKSNVGGWRNTDRERERERGKNNKKLEPSWRNAN